MKHITSSKNPFVKNITQLQKKKAERKAQGVFVVEGIKGVRDIQNKAEIVYYILTEAMWQQQVVVTDENITYVVTEDVYKAMSDTDTPQGVMAVAKQNVYTLDTLPTVATPFYLILENVQDPGNLGTIIRTAYGLGVDAVFLSKGCVDVYSPKVTRSTMSGIVHIPLVVDVEMTTCLSYLKEQDVATYATALEESKALYDQTLTGKIALIIGNEANGVSEETKRMVDGKVRIPMPGGLESLNAAVAAGICMYEAMKQRNNLDN